jgi:hypothetical protein
MSNDDYYELRLYHCTPGRVNDLHHRMGWELPPLFERHGVVQPLAYWDGFAGFGAPLYAYMLRWRSLDERFRAFGGFYADPDWARQRDASNVGEHMIDRLDLMIMRQAPAWSAGIDAVGLNRRSGLHELRLQRLNTADSKAAIERLAEHDLPFIAENGGAPLGLFTTWYGSRTPQAVMLIEWPDFATREAAVTAQDDFDRASDRLRGERARHGRPLALDYDVHLMKPAVYPAR